MVAPFVMRMHYLIPPSAEPRAKFLLVEKFTPHRQVEQHVQQLALKYRALQIVLLSFVIH